MKKYFNAQQIAKLEDVTSTELHPGSVDMTFSKAQFDLAVDVVKVD